MSTDKELLRTQIKKKKLSKASKSKGSFQVCKILEKSSFFSDAETMGFYAAAPDEVDLMPLAKKALLLGKKIYFPRVCGKMLEFRAVKDLKKNFKLGAFQILEPDPKKTQKRVKPMDVIFVPGRAFDAQGGRLGRGGGHYDRLLAKWRSSVRVGVGFKSQKVKCVPMQKHDVRMDAVVVG